MRKHLFNILKLAVSVALIAFIFLFVVDLRTVLDKISQARWEFLLGAALLMIAGTALRALRWRVLLEPLEIRVPISKLVYLYFVGALFNLFLPTGLGGDAVKMAMLGRYTGRVPEAIGTTLVDRATGLWVLFVLALVALPFSQGVLPPATITTIAVITISGAVGGFLVMGTPLLPWLGSKIRLPGQEKMERFYHSVAQLGYPALAKACLVSLIFNLMLIAFNMLIALSLGVNLPLRVFILFGPILSLTLAIPISISGLGTRETAYITLYGTMGVLPETAIAMSFTDYLLTYVVIGLIGGLLYGINNLKGIIQGEEKTENKRELRE